MFYNTPNGLQLETENGWIISISLAGEEAKEYCEIAVWPTGLGNQDNWIRWGDNSIELPEEDYPIYDRVLSRLTPSDLITIINRLSDMPKKSVQPNKWLAQGLIKTPNHQIWDTLWR